MKKYQTLPSLLVSLAMLAFMLYSCQPSNENKRKRIEMDTIASLPTPSVLKYGIPVDSFLVEDGTIRPNQHLSHILSGYGVSMATIDQIARQAREIFDVRRIKNGNKDRKSVV